MSKKPHNPEDLKVMANKVEGCWAGMVKMSQHMEALVATINADRAEGFSDRVAMWKIEAMLNFILKKNGTQLPLPEGSPEDTPRQTVSWYSQFLPKWKKFMADFQIATTEGVIPDEKIKQEGQPTEAVQPLESPTHTGPVEVPASLGGVDEAKPGNGPGTVLFPSPRPDAGSQA